MKEKYKPIKIALCRVDDLLMEVSLAKGKFQAKKILQARSEIENIQKVLSLLT